MFRSSKVFVLLTLSCPAASALASEETDALAQLRAELAELRQTVGQLQDRLAAQEARCNAPSPAPESTSEKDALAAQLAQELGTPATISTVEPSTTTAPIVLARGGKNYLNLSLDALVAAGTSTVPDVSRTQIGGHDPSQRGFTLQNLEMVLEGAVDPYLKGQANLVWQLDAAGESVVELEEAYLTTTALPYNLQVKAGTFFTEFGRLNAQHPHSWDFVDQPLVNGRLLGPDGLRGPGARVSWLAPTPFYLETSLTVQNSQGETGFSFRNVPGEELFGRTISGRSVKTWRDMLWTPRVSASFDLSDTQTLLLGTTAAHGPNGSGGDTYTSLYGLDLFWKWKSPHAQAGFPFAKLQVEAISRRYEAGASESLPRETLRDSGAYAQASWGFRRGWIVGLRGDWVNGNDAAFAPDPLRDRRWRAAANLTWFPTEFSKLRLQWNHDRLEDLGSEQSLWLQAEFLLGAHAAHKF